MVRISWIPVFTGMTTFYEMVFIAFELNYEKTPQSAMHHVGCVAALNLTRFRAQLL